MNKKIIVAAIAIVILITGVVYVGMMKKSLPVATEQEKTGTTQVVEKSAAVDNSRQNPSQSATKEIKGKVLGIAEKNIAIEKTGGSELLNINAKTPVSSKDKTGADVKSSLANLKVGSDVDVTYNDGSNVVSILILN